MVKTLELCARFTGIAIGFPVPAVSKVFALVLNKAHHILQWLAKKQPNFVGETFLGAQTLAQLLQIR